MRVFPTIEAAGPATDARSPRVASIEAHGATRNGENHEDVDAQREGFDNLDTANGLEREIKALSHEINEGLTRIGKMRSHLPDEYHRSFDAIVAKGYMPMIEAKRRTIKALELATDDLRGHARNVAGDASAA
jgi:hypothetical protein